MFVSTTSSEREEEILWAYPPFSNVCVFAQGNHSDFVNRCSMFICNYDHSVQLIMRFGEEDRVFVTESDNYSDGLFV